MTDIKGGGLRVLVVDDVEELRRLLRVILESEVGVSVLEAASGEEAVALVEDDHVDLVVMDQSMPGMSGLECTRELRRLRPGLAIVGFTSMPDGEAAWLRAGAARHFTKPQVDPLIAYIAQLGAGGGSADGLGGR